MTVGNSLIKNIELEKLVENQTTYTTNHAEMHLFETHRSAEQVLLKFNQPILASMLEGKKVMHLNRLNSFDFLPGESLILPANEMMCIDFPEAEMNNPTRCLAMAISEDKIKSTIQYLNESRNRIDGEWNFTDYNFHFTNDLGLQQIVHRLMYLFREDHPSKELFTDFTLQELIIRILQAETRKLYSEKSLELDTSHRLAHVINFIRKHIDQDLSIKVLSSEACMSESNFYRVFKNELGISPVDFIINERIKLASSLLKNPTIRIKEVYMECGFNSLSYFTRLFKKKKNCTPKEFQLAVQMS